MNRESLYDLAASQRVRTAILVVAVLAVYGGILNHGFVYDDKLIIVDNPSLQHGGNLLKYFLLEDKIDVSTGYYRPLTYISFALERMVWGLNPVGYNITNLSLHLLVVLLFRRLAEVLFKNADAAFAAALIFALHPLAGETVNFHSGGRNTLLCACFSLLSLLMYHRGRIAASVAAFTLALFAKEFALLLPPALAVVECRGGFKPERLKRLAGYLLPIAAYFILRSFAVQKANFLAQVNLSRELWLSPYLAVRYLLHMVFPFNLKVTYAVSPQWVTGSLSLLLLLLLAGVLYRWRKDETVTLSSLSILLFLLPVIDIVRIPGHSWLADRYAYFSLMGFAVLLVELLRRWNKRAMIGVLAAVALTYAVVDVMKNRVWKDDHAFYSRMIRDEPESYAGYQSLGMTYYRNGERAKAEEYLATAVAKKGILPVNLVRNAGIFLESGKLDLAEQALLKEARLEPENPEVYFMLASLSREKGDEKGAASYLEKGRKMVPEGEASLRERQAAICRGAEQLIEAGRYYKAEVLLRGVLLIDSRYVPALVDLGGVNAQQGNYPTAVRLLEKAVAIEPGNESARYNLQMVRQMAAHPASP